jgi:hypothetical protein
MPLQPAPPARLLTASKGWSRDRWFRLALMAFAVALLGAFWMLCSHQVRKAQMRDMSLEVQRVAVADCLQYIPRATLNSCVNRVDPSRHDGANAALDPAGRRAAAQDAPGASMSSAAVSVSYH